jgi:phosphotransferase system HPr (HPr) family protein
MKTTHIVILDPVGLHARPAALFVDLASKFQSIIQVRNLSTQSSWVNAKSILSLLTCGIKQGDEIAIQADGEDENEAIDALESLIRSNFS